MRSLFLYTCHAIQHKLTILNFLNLRMNSHVLIQNKRIHIHNLFTHLDDLKPLKTNFFRLVQISTSTIIYISCTNYNKLLSSWSELTISHKYRSEWDDKYLILVLFFYISMTSLIILWQSLIGPSVAIRKTLSKLFVNILFFYLVFMQFNNLSC